MNEFRILVVAALIAAALASAAVVAQVAFTRTAARTIERVARLG